MRTLKEFAEWYLGDGENLKINMEGAGVLRVGENSTEFVLYRDAPFQVTLLTFFPGYVIPPHTHKYVSTYNISLHGDGHAIVGNRYWTKKTQAKPNINNRIAVPAGINHYGHSNRGTVFLSIQKWVGCDPGLLSTDWVSDIPFGKIR